MYSHIFIGVHDFDRALAFYQPLMSTLGLMQRFVDHTRPWAGWQSSPGPRPLFLIGQPFDQQAPQPGNGQMVAWLAETRAVVDQAHAAALVHGGTCAGAPGLRPQYHEHYYGTYFRDPDGNKLCVACHTPPAAAPTSTPTQAAVMAHSLRVADALQPVLAELQCLEPLFHGAGPGATAAHFENLVAPEFWEVGASGRRYGRDFVLAVVKSRGREPDENTWQTSDLHVSEVAPACYLLTYTLQQPGRLTRRATLWRRDGTRWQAVYHQGTVVEPGA